MFCSRCGTQIPEIANFCPVCGTTADKVVAVPSASTSETIIQPAAAIVTPAPVAAPISAPISAPAATPVSAAPVMIQTASPAIVPAASQGMAPAAYLPDYQTPLPTAQKTKKKGSNKKLILIAAAAIAAVLLVLAGVFLFKSFTSNKSGNGYPQSSSLLIISEQNQSLIYGSGNKAIKTDGFIYDYKYSMDGKSAALAMDPGDSGTYRVAYCNGSKVVDVADDVSAYTISSSGNKILYLTDYDSSLQTGVLYLYDTNSKKSEKVAKDAYSEFTVSPDGGSIAYVSDVTFDDDGSISGLTGYIKIGDKKAEKLDQDQYVIAISNSGSYLYYMDADFTYSGTTSLYLRHGKTDNKISKVSPASGFYLNKDYSEIVFVSGSNTYISVNGNNKEKIVTSAYSGMILPSKIQYYYNSISSAYAYVVNVPSLLDNLYISFNDDYSAAGVVYVDKSANPNDIDKFGSQYAYYLSGDGKSFYFIDESEQLVIYKNVRNLKADPVKIKSNEDVQAFDVTPDQSTVYFVDVDNTLWVARGSSKPVKVDENVDISYLTISADGKGLYYLKDYTYNSDTYIGVGTLCYVENEKSAKPDTIAEDVSGIDVSEYGTVYYVFDHYDDATSRNIGNAYLSLNGGDFKSVSEDAVIW